MFLVSQAVPESFSIPLGSRSLANFSRHRLLIALCSSRQEGASSVTSSSRLTLPLEQAISSEAMFVGGVKKTLHESRLREVNPTLARCRSGGRD